MFLKERDILHLQKMNIFDVSQTQLIEEHSFDKNQAEISSYLQLLHTPINNIALPQRQLNEGLSTLLPTTIFDI